MNAHTLIPRPRLKKVQITIPNENRFPSKNGIFLLAKPGSGRLLRRVTLIKNRFSPMPTT